LNLKAIASKLALYGISEEAKNSKVYAFVESHATRGKPFVFTIEGRNINEDLKRSCEGLELTEQLILAVAGLTR